LTTTNLPGKVSAVFLRRNRTFEGEEIMNSRLAWASAIGVLALAPPAVAHTVNCAADSDRLQEALIRLEHGATLTIKGNCVGNITVATDGVSFVAHKDGGSITGQVQVTAQRVSFSGVSILGPEPADPNTIIRGGLVARNGGSVNFTGGAIANHTKTGVIAVDNGSITITASTITGNGTANIMNASDGVQAVEGGSVFLGAQDANNDPIPSAAVEVAQNSFRGLLATRSGSIRVLAANIHDNGAQAAVTSFGGSMRITGGTLSTPMTATPFDTVIAAFGGTVDIENDTGNPVSNTTITSASGGVLAVDSGAARLRGVTITTSATPVRDPAVGAFRSASVRLQGNNTIVNTGGGGALAAGDAGSARTDDGSASAFPSGPNQLTGSVSATNGGFVRLVDSNSGSTLTGNITIANNGLLELQTERGTITGNITLVGPGTLIAAQAPINFTGTLTCFKNSSPFGPVNPVIVGVPAVFNPPLVGCTP
jgi:hypothetical protein